MLPPLHLHPINVIVFDDPKNTKVIKNRKPRPSIDKRGFFKTAATYSPTVTQYHRRDEA